MWPHRTRDAFAASNEDFGLQFSISPLLQSAWYLHLSSVIPSNELSTPEQMRQLISSIQHGKTTPHWHWHYHSVRFRNSNLWNYRITNSVYFQHFNWEQLKWMPQANSNLLSKPKYSRNTPVCLWHCDMIFHSLHSFIHFINIAQVSTLRHCAMQAEGRIEHWLETRYMDPDCQQFMVQQLIYRLA